MKKILLVYKSKTGFTKKYAQWLNEEIDVTMMPFEKMTIEDIHDHDIIIYGAGIHAGNIFSFKAFKKKIAQVNDKDFIVFATGAAPYIEADYQILLKRNFLEDEKKHMKFFYFQSGLNYELMSTSDKLLMKSYYTFLSLKNQKSEIEKNTIKALMISHDLCDKSYLKPMVDYIKNKF